MPFNSSEFLILFLITFAAYWLFGGNARRQNILILIASYVFYGWFDPRFLFILFSVTTVGYLAGLAIDQAKSQRTRKCLLFFGVLLIGGSLAVMKYYNFFTSSLSESAKLFSYEIHLDSLRILLPIGLSFYVFQTIGYIADVYRGKISPEKSALNFYSYVSFFPSLLAGPIAQSTKILPQFSQKRTLDFSSANEGLELIVWGLFKKVVVADSLVKTVAYIFGRYEDQTGSTLAIGIALYSIQLYADFSGYSDMARGLAKLLGFDLMRNFNLPYFSRDTAEFWRNWHRSLSAWMKEYIYLPLGGRGKNKYQHARNILITFTFSGLWHGASWNFVIWGFLNGLFLMPKILFGNSRRFSGAVAENRLFPNFIELSQMLIVFTLISLSRVFFRTPDIASAIGYFKIMFSASLFSLPDLNFLAFWTIPVMLGFEWFVRRTGVTFPKLDLVVKYPAYVGMLVTIIFALSSGNNREYLYFKF